MMAARLLLMVIVTVFAWPAEAQAQTPEYDERIDVAYIDADGKLHDDLDGSTATTDDDGAVAYVLDGSETTLGKDGETTWYVCQTPATENDGKGLAYSGKITLKGDVRIILADGCKMTVTYTDGDECFYGGSAFYIYGQEEGTGILDFGGAYNGIYSNCNMTICGGNITASGNHYGIDVYGSVTITGGTVIAIGTNATGIFANGSVTISGGTVNATGARGIFADDNVTISGGDITATATTTNSGDVSLGLECNQKLTVSGGKLTATATSINDDKSYGIYAHGAIEIGDAEVTASGTCKGSAESYGIYANSTLTINKGTVTATAEGGSYSQAKSYGIYASGAISFEDATVTASSKSEFSDDTYGIYANNGLTINKGIVTATAENNSYDESVGIYCKKDMTATYADITAIGSSMGTHDNIGINVQSGDLNITGGTTTAKGLCDYSGHHVGIQVRYGSDEDKGHVNIHGGKVHAIGKSYGIYADVSGSTVPTTLDWLDASDEIVATSYYGTVKTADGKRFVAYDVSDTEETASGIVSGTMDTDFTADDIAGKTLRPIDGKYVATTNSHVTLSGYNRTFDLTDDDLKTHYYIYKPTDNVTLTYTNSSGEQLEMSGLPDGTNYDAATGTFAMPAQDVTLTMHRYLTSVKYLDWDDTNKQLVEKDTGTDNNAANDKVYVLDGWEKTIGTAGTDENNMTEAWYICNTPATENDGKGLVYDQYFVEGTDHYLLGLADYCHVHLVLADNSKMEVTNNMIENDYSIFGKDDAGASLTIYGQSEGTGELSFDGYTAGIEIYGDLTINGGKVSNNSSYSQSINCIGELTINGGTVTVSGSKYGISSSGDVTINGGQVTAKCSNYGIYSNNGNITLGWSSDKDYIHASNYYANDDVKTADGKRFAAYDAETGTAASAIVSGTRGTDFTAANIAGKVLRPIDGNDVATTNGNVTFSGYNRAFDLTNAGTTTHHYVYKSADNVALTYDNSGGEQLDVRGLPDGTNFDAATNSFSMPAQDVTLILHRYLTGVKYMDQNGDEQAVNKVYLLEGNEGPIGESYEDWYMARGNLTYNNGLSLGTNINLILADGATMTVTGPNGGNGIDGGTNFSLDLYGQSDGDNAGVLNIAASGAGSSAMNVGQFFTESGTLNIAGGDTGIKCHDTNSGMGMYGSSKISIQNVTNGVEARYANIRGGELTMTNISGKGIILTGYATSYWHPSGFTISEGKADITSAGNAIEADIITYAGGQLTATATGAGAHGIAVPGAHAEYEGISLKWNQSTDYLKASSYNGPVSREGADKSLFTYDGQDGPIAVDPDANYTAAQVDAIAGQKLIPVFSVEGLADPDGDGYTDDKYIPFYTNNGDFKLPANVKAYVPVGYDLTTGTVILEEVEGIPDKKLVFLGNADETKNVPATINITGVPASSANPDDVTVETIEDSYEEKTEGQPEAVKLAQAHFVTGGGGKTIGELIETILGTTTDQALVYIFEHGMFKPLEMGKTQDVSGDTGFNIKPSEEEMLLIITKWELLQALNGLGGGGGGAVRQRTISIVLGDDATGIRDITIDAACDAWYTLDGRKLDSTPKTKGVYIRSGRKVVIK